ncbi:MAG: SDR family oxidoreductase, partial [Chloroflexota bacterium]
MGRVQDKVCIVTGAAQGIGAAIVADLAKEGGKVVVADLNEDGAAAVADRIKADGGDAIAVKVDVTDEASVQAMIAKTVEAFGRLDVLFNNAGVNKPMSMLEVTRQNWDMIMTVNGWGVLLCMREAAKQMIEQGGGGKIINTASAVARTGFPGIAPYCAR